MDGYILHDAQRTASLETYVTGRDRPLYFKRPLVPTMAEQPIVQMIQPAQQREQQEQEGEDQMQEGFEEEMFAKSVEVQTDYRDSEAQTMPYTPDYTIADGENPEILSIKQLQFGKGLPASIDELEMIEQQREKQWFDNALPPISDESSFALRRKLMEGQELREWTKKENEIKKVQNEKLYLLQSGLIEREKDTEEKSAQRIEDIKIKKTEAKNRLIAKVQRSKIKGLRKLLKRRKELDIDQRKRELIEQYTNFGSKVYAGITREGLSIDKIANKFEVQPMSLNTYQGISDLQENIKPSYFESQISIKKTQEQIEKKYGRLETQHKLALKVAMEQIQGVGKIVTEEPSQYKQFSQENIKDRKATPIFTQHLQLYYFFSNQQQLLRVDASEIEIFTKGDMKTTEKANDKSNAQKRLEWMQKKIEREQAVLLLQRLIKGRYWQNIMYEGKEKRMALIEELLKIAKLEDLNPDQFEEILQEAHEEKVRNAVLEGLQGEVISDMMDLLAKELVRFQQEKKVQQMVEKAEGERRIREIEESGQRQAEAQLRHREDALYNQIMNVHQTTVDNYLHFIMNNTLEKAAVRQARIMAGLRKEQTINAVENIERQINKRETVIKDLVSSFLIPNINRIEKEEQRFAESSKISMQQILSNVENKIPK